MRAMTKHKHDPKHFPPSGTGYQVCDCGATRRVIDGISKDSWHVCKLCVNLIEREEEEVR